MDRITILLQDKATIEKLAADPEVKIRIKDAVLDGVGKRALKLANITNDITKAAQREIYNEFFVDGPTHILKAEYKNLIKKRARTEMNMFLEEEIKECEKELREAIRSWKLEVLEKLNEYDIEKDIREVAAEVIREKFKAVLPNHIVYDMRTTFYSRCKECGIADAARDEFVGHSLGALGNAYTDLSDEYLLKEGTKFYY